MHAASSSSPTGSDTSSPAVGADEAIKQAEDQIATLSAATKRDTRLLDAAKSEQAAVLAQIASLQTQIVQAKATLVQFARQTYILGANPDILNGFSALTSGDPTSYGEAQKVLAMVGTAQSQQIQAAAQLLASVESQRGAAEAAVVAAEKKLTESLTAEHAARDMLAIAQGAAVSARTPQTFTTYPVSDCSFGTAPTPSTCRQAQQWALDQVANPTQNWFNSCLNFVTDAYGDSGGAPSAIAMWNSLPASDKHAPTTVAPPGALMFWGPNHVALSLGNNVLISTDVLGNGRAWIVSFAEMQTAWHLQYLGWSPPDFANGG